MGSPIQYASIEDILIAYVKMSVDLVGMDNTTKNIDFVPRANGTASVIGLYDKDNPEKGIFEGYDWGLGGGNVGLVDRQTFRWYLEAFRGITNRFFICGVEATEEVRNRYFDLVLSEGQ